jgi:hypothetical protein
MFVFINLRIIKRKHVKLQHKLNMPRKGGLFIKTVSLIDKKIIIVAINLDSLKRSSLFIEYIFISIFPHTIITQHNFVIAVLEMKISEIYTPSVFRIYAENMCNKLNP